MNKQRKSKTAVTVITLAVLMPMLALAITGKLDRWTTTTTADCSTCGSGPSGNCTKVEVENCACDAPCPPQALLCTCETYAGPVPQRSYTGVCNGYVGDTQQTECGTFSNCYSYNPTPYSTVWVCVVCDITGVPATLGTSLGTGCNAAVLYGGCSPQLRMSCSELN
jgi:hypothetical protein